MGDARDLYDIREELAQGAAQEAVAALKAGTGPPKRAGAVDLPPLAGADFGAVDWVPVALGITRNLVDLVVQYGGPKLEEYLTAHKDQIHAFLSDQAFQQLDAIAHKLFGAGPLKR